MTENFMGIHVLLSRKTDLNWYVPDECMACFTDNQKWLSNHNYWILFCFDQFYSSNSCQTYLNLDFSLKIPRKVCSNFVSFQHNFCLNFRTFSVRINYRLSLFLDRCIQISYFESVHYWIWSHFSCFYTWLQHYFLAWSFLF